MELEKSIDIIITQEQKEIKNYNIFATGVIIAFFALLCFNLISGYIKDIAAACTNFLTLAVGYIPFQQIIKRRKKIIYFDKIIRAGMAGTDADKSAFDSIILDAIKDALKQ